jgi:hypothetical protein
MGKTKHNVDTARELMAAGVSRRLAQKAARVLERFGTVAVEGRRITVTLRVKGKADMARTCQYVR